MSRHKRKQLKHTLKKLDSLERKHLLCAQATVNSKLDEEYDAAMAPLIAMIMTDINAKASANGAAFAQQHLLHKGLKIFGERGEKASLKEVNPNYTSDSVLHRFRFRS